MRKASLLRSISVLFLGLVGVLVAGCSLPAALADTAVVPASSLAQESQITPVNPVPIPDSEPNFQDSIPSTEPTPLPNTQYPRGGFRGGGWGMHGNWGIPRDNESMPGGRWGMRGGWGMDRQDWGMGMMGGNWSACCGANGFGHGLLPGDDTVAPVAPEEVSFMSDVQPIFNERCIVCHGGTSGLFLSSYEEIMRGGANGAIITPGDPASSRLIQFVNSGYMPYGGPPLAYGQAQTLMNWVATGAPDN